MQQKWDVPGVLRRGLIGVPVSSRIYKVTKAESTAKSACALITGVVIVNRPPSSATAGSEPELRASDCRRTLKPSGRTHQLCTNGVIIFFLDLHLARRGVVTAGSPSGAFKLMLLTLNVMLPCVAGISHHRVGNLERRK